MDNVYHLDNLDILHQNAFSFFIMKRKGLDNAYDDFLNVMAYYACLHVSNVAVLWICFYCYQSHIFVAYCGIFVIWTDILSYGIKSNENNEIGWQRHYKKLIN